MWAGRRFGGPTTAAPFFASPAERRVVVNALTMRNFACAPAKMIGRVAGHAAPGKLMKRNERRQHPRVDVVASAVVLMPGSNNPVRYVVEDLSVGGALLREGPPLQSRGVMRVVLYLKGSAPLVVDAETVRQEQDGASSSGTAIAFRRLTAVQEDIIQDAILNALEALNGPDSGVRVRADGDSFADPPAAQDVPSRRKRR